ncbi:MAG: hypothetical protein NTX86_05980 [Candidatus Dependentiae bacterium]|nr:hypothetical protein [Candidatus Dependentiae bacterium]
MNISTISKSLVLVLVGSSLAYADIKPRDPFADMRKEHESMQAAKPWNQVVETGLYALGSGALGFAVAGYNCMPNETAKVVGSTVVATALGALIGYYKNQQYQAVYDKNEGRNMFGAAAANDVEGMMAWNGYSWMPASVLSMQKHDTKRGSNVLHIAAVNGATGAAELALCWMPATQGAVKQTQISTSEEYDSQLGRWVGKKTDGWMNNADKAKRSKTEVLEEIRTIDIKDNAHKTAAEYTALNGHTETLALLIQRGASIDEIRKWAESNPEYRNMLEGATQVYRAQK